SGLCWRADWWCWHWSTGASSRSSIQRWSTTRSTSGTACTCTSPPCNGWPGSLTSSSCSGRGRAAHGRLAEGSLHGPFRLVEPHLDHLVGVPLVVLGIEQLQRQHSPVPNVAERAEDSG